MPSCIVKGCSFSWKKKDPAITIHAFPRSKEMIKAWLMQTGQDFGDIEAFTDKVFEGKKTDSFRICSQHFTSDSYTNEGMRRSLKRDALPTIFNCVVQASAAVKKIQKKKERPPRPKSAKKIRSRMTQRILNITLEIIYLLTGEDYTVVKSRKRAKMRESGELDVPQAPTTETPPPPSHSSEESNDRRILELAYKIIQLLNGEEGDYLEGHHDFYADMLNNEQSFRSRDLSEHGLVIYTSHNKEESMLYEEGSLGDPSIYTPGGHHPYICTHDKDESISQEEGNLTDTDIPCTLIKEEPPSCDEENLTDKDDWALADPAQQDASSHVQEETASDLSEHGLVIYTSHNKEESMLYKEGSLEDPYTPGGHHPYICTHDKDESISQEEGNLTDTDIPCTLIKEEPPSCDEENLTDKDDWTVEDHAQQDSSSHGQEETASGKSARRRRDSSSHVQEETASGKSARRRRDSSSHVQEETASGKSARRRRDSSSHVQEETASGKSARRRRDSSSHVQEETASGKSARRRRDSSSHVQEETASGKSARRRRDSSTSDEEEISDQLLLKQSTPDKNESILGKVGRLLNPADSDEMERNKARAKEKVYGPEGEIEYTIVRIKDSPSCEEDNTPTVDFHQEDDDMQEDNTVSADLSRRGGTVTSSSDAAKTYQCVGCQKHFTTKTDLQTHQTIHKTFQKSICPECGKTFLCTSALITHRQSHTGEKPFSCTVCAKSFRQLSQLKTHERIHTDERPFSCLVCGKCFRCRSHLISHARIHKEDAASVL